MSPKGIVLVFVCAGVVVAANLLLRLGLERSGVVPFARGIAGVPWDILALLAQPAFLVAFALYGLSLLLWLRLVATEPLSVAYPLLAAVTFIALAVVSLFLLSEQISVRKIAGLTAIIIGFFLVSGVS